MEALAILGLAGNIIQFLDFGTKLIRGTHELYHSTDGATSSNLVLEDISRDLTQICAAMVPPVTNNISDTDAALLSLSAPCRSLGQELLDKLGYLKVKGRQKRWQSARQALRTAWKAKEIQRYEQQLASYRSQITLRLLTVLIQKQEQTSRWQASYTRNEKSVAEALDCLNEDYRRLGICTVNEAAELREKIVEVLEEASYDSGKSVIQIHDQHDSIGQANSTADPLTDIPFLLGRMRSAGSLLAKQMLVINQLEFPRISEREQNIHEAHPTTFEWLFDAESGLGESTAGSRILQWLQRGSGIFWVSGKAGSGKSTLMKFLYQNKQTATALRQWAGSRRLLIARHFFWNAGTPMQKSQQGLLQTLLYHVLRQDPTLIPLICPQRWSYSHSQLEQWSHDEVLQAFKKLKTESLASIRICFFIDGLDEFEGDHLDIIQTMSDFTSSEAIKVCLSSRPWAVFQGAYGTGPHPMIRLQDLTRGDILRFVEDRLAEGTQFQTLRTTNKAYENLVHEILERSDGVFLWVFLVVRSLRRGMTNFDTVSELQRRLHELPTELEVFFQHILDSTDKVYHEQAARLYLIKLVAAEAPALADLSMFDKTNVDFALDDKLILTHQPHSVALLEILKTRILAQCQDLLEFDYNTELQYLHRTVRDFLETRDIQNLLHERAGREFNAHHFISNSMLYQMRLVVRYKGSLQWFKSRLKTFWYHAQQLEIENAQDYRLFPLLDRTGWSFRHSAPVYYAGWLADAAVEHGVEGFLLREPHVHMAVLNKNGIIIHRPRLDVVLRRMRSHRRLDLVKCLLNAGVHPNEIITRKTTTASGTDLSIWKCYIGGLDERAPAFEEKIIAMLLINGADPTIGGSDKYFFSNCLTSAHIDGQTVVHLEALRLDLMKQQQQGTSSGEILSSRSAAKGSLPEDNRQASFEAWQERVSHKGVPPLFQHELGRNLEPAGG